jgi:hypothetical protein
MSTTASGHTIEERKHRGDNIARATRAQLERRWSITFHGGVALIATMDGGVERWELVQGRHSSNESQWELRR